MAAVDPTNDQKRALARDVGAHLVRTYGKRNHYAPAVVAATVRRLKHPAAWDCWASSLFSTRVDFEHHHRTHDYNRMRAEMLDAVNGRPRSETDGTDWSALGDLLTLWD